MSKTLLDKTFCYFFASVWVINGLFCKVLNYAPRHQFIVERILGNEYGSILTKLIGFSEIIMALWIISTFRYRYCAIAQITVVGLMNVIEFFLAPDLLLFGKCNSVFAMVFMLLVYYHAFVFQKKDFNN